MYSIHLIQFIKNKIEFNKIILDLPSLLYDKSGQSMKFLYIFINTYNFHKLITRSVAIYSIPRLHISIRWTLIFIKYILIYF